jgi:hypothetical protein
MDISSQSKPPPDPSGGRAHNFASHHKHPSNSSMHSQTSSGSAGRLVSSGALLPIYSLSPLSGNNHGLEGLDEDDLTYFLNSGTPDGLSQTNISPGLSYFSGKTHLSHPRSFAPASGLNEYQQVLPPTQEETVLDANGRKQKMTSVNYPATPATQYYTSKPSKKYPTSGNKAYVYVHPTQQHAVPLTMNNFSSFHNTKQRAPPNLAHTSFSPSGLVTERGQMLPPPPRLPLSNSTDNMENLSQSFTGLGHQQQPSDSRIRSGIRNSAQPQPLTDADKDHLKWIKQLNNLAVENRKGQSPQIGKSLPERGAVPQFPQFAQPKQKSDTKPAAPLYSSGEKGPTQYVISQPHLLGLRSSYNANTPSPQPQIN